MKIKTIYSEIIEMPGTFGIQPDWDSAGIPKPKGYIVEYPYETNEFCEVTITEE